MHLLIALARNVNNTDQFGQFAERISDDPVVLAWLKGPFRKWVISEGPAIQIKEVGADSPAWAREAAAKGDLFQIDYDAAENAVRPVLDYFKHLTQTGGRFDRMTFVEADKQQREWHEQLAAKAGSSVLKEDGVSLVHMSEDGYAWVKVFGKQSLDREGEIMGHCVGSYFDQVERGDTVVYSLRDTKNIPHVTVEYDVELNSIEQIKGTANSKIKAKYKPYVMGLLNSMRLKKIFLDESGISEREAKAGLVFTPKKTERIVAHEVSFNLTTPSMPSLKYNEHEYATFGPLTFVNGSIQDASTKSFDKDKALRVLEHLMLNNLCGFSLFRAVQGFLIGNDAVDDMVLSHTSYRQVIGRTTFVVGQKQGGLWPLVRWKQLYKSNLVVLDRKGNPNAFIQATGESARLLEVFKVDDQAADDLRTWMGSRELINGSMKNNARIRAFLDRVNQSKIETLDTSILSYKQIEHNIPLLNAFRPFVGDHDAIMDLIRIAKLADKMDAVEDVRALFRREKIPVSGYLYDYFKSFFILLLMSNKRLAFSMVCTMVSLAKQLDTFSISPHSIMSGAFGRRADEAKLTSAYHVINTNLHRMLPYFDDLTKGINSNIASKLMRIYKRFYSKK